MTMADRALEVVRRKTLVRPRDLEAEGIPREHLLRLYRQGVLRRAARGVYTLAQARVTVHHTLSVVNKKFPSGIICLLSALRFHGLTTQDPREVWIAIGNKARKPSSDFPPVRTVRFSGRALTQGVEIHDVEGMRLPVYTVAKTVADCFKYRNKIGVDVAIEALRDALRTRQATVDEIHRFAKVCRVAKIMQPYLESAV
jgi:predicted transcriptional regulator of viral defense system